MAEAVVPARGFRDVLPQEKAKREAILASIRRSYSKFGFTEIETPAVELLERLSSNQGGENEKLVFRVLRRGLAPDEVVTVAEACDLGLRYDLTVPLVRFYASHGHGLPGIFRSLQIGSVWRAERPQKGRYRQFVQCDIDILGDPTIMAEIELINATLFALDELGIADTMVRLNDRRVLDSLLSAFGVPTELRAGALVTIDKIDKIGVDGVCEGLEKSGLAGTSVAGIKSVLEGLEATDKTDVDSLLRVLPNGLDAEGLSAVREIREAVLAAGTRDRQIVFDPSLVRGMGYYTGPIFEIAHASSRNSICGGGRYDKMGEQLFGRPVPASGFSIGFERIVDLVSDARFTPVPAALAIVYDHTPVASLAALQARYVRDGRRVILAPRAKNLSKQLTDLGQQGAAAFCLVDDSVKPDSALEERPFTSRP